MLASLIVVMAMFSGSAVSDTVPAVTPPAPTLVPPLHYLYPLPIDVYGDQPAIIPADDGLSQQQRARAVRHSDFYYTRLKVHRVGAIVMIPLALTQYFVGQELFKNGTSAAQWVQDIHRPLAAAIAVDFGVNAVTGIWNGIEDWGSPGSARRNVHSALMLLAGAGFVAVVAIAPDREDNGILEGNPSRHRRLAISSMAVMAASGLLMKIWK
jgi:succinate dehydrogenase hydrophobic anchor subunit